MGFFSSFGRSIGGMFGIGGLLPESETAKLQAQLSQAQATLNAAFQTGMINYAKDQEKFNSQMIGLVSINSNIKVAIGPCIGKSSYEIGPEFRDIFINSSANNNQFFKPTSRKGHHMFDLASYIEHRLLDVGITEIYKTGYDTCQNEDLFFSYRRSVKRGEQGYGRGLSVITMGT